MTSQVDAIVRSGPTGQQVFTLEGAQRPYRLMVEAMDEGALTLAADGGILYCNARCADLLKTGLDQIIGSNIRKFVTSRDAEKLVALMRELSTASQRKRIELLRTDGARIAAYITIRELKESMAQPSFVAVVTDISELTAEQAKGGLLNANLARELEESRNAQIALAQTSRALRMINACNVGVAHASTEAEMLANVCHAVVEANEYKLAWVGYAEDDAAKSVRPMAMAGEDSGYPKDARISWADVPLGQGPAGTAIRTGKTVIAQDITTDPTFAPWRLMAAKSGYRSSLAIPLTLDGKTLGVLVIYSGLPNVFDTNEIALIETFAGELAYGIDALRAGIARDQLARIVDSAQDAIIGKDLDGLIKSWNKGAEKLYGYTADEIIGQSAEVLFPSDCRAELAKILQRVRHGETIATDEVERVDKAGKRHQVSATHSPIMDRAGAIVGVSSIVHDITELKRAQATAHAAARYARNLIEASLDPLVTISAEGKVTDVNEATVQATGIGRDKIVGSDFAGYFTEPDKAKAGYREAFAKDSVKDYALTLRHRSGTTMDVLYNATVYRDADGKVAGLVAAARDVTERNRSEEELRKNRIGLEEMVSVRTQELAVSNQDLESFAYSVSHDLRAPLRAIDGFSHILLEDYAGKIDTEGQRLLNVVRDNTSKMGRLIDDILAFSRAGRTEITPAFVDMEALVGAAIKDLDADTAGRKVNFKVGALPQARGDGAMLERVWANLLGNAVKYSAPKPDARIEIGATSSDGETVYFVRDNGVGFDMQYVDKLFGVFQRLHGAEFDGTGIGLAIVKRIVTRHGGRVSAEGKPNEGATFYFSLPAKKKSDA